MSLPQMRNSGAVAVLTCLFGLLLADVARAALLSEAPQVQRRGSHLQVDWTADVAGTWVLSDEVGTPCLSGKQVVGANHLHLDTLSAPTGVHFTYALAKPGASSGQVTQSVLIAGESHLSALPKPAGAATIYQLPPRTYLARDVGKDQAGRLNDLTTARLNEIRTLGVDYIWVTGVLAHADRSQTDPDAVKGEAGSYYAIYDNWNVAPELGSLDDFDALIARAHAVGLRVMIDIVPNHTARVHRTSVVCKAQLDFGKDDTKGSFFSPNNNYFYVQGSTFAPPPEPGNPGADGVFDTDIFSPGIQLESPARVTGNDIVSAKPQISDWYETAKLNYGWDIVARQAHYNPRPRTWDQMLDVGKYWVAKGVDGFRVDFAHPVPVEFWQYFAGELHKLQPQLFLLGEAYETDNRMKLPNFSFYALLDAGFDSIYDADMFWAMHNQVQRPGDMRSAIPARSPALASNIVGRGFMFTHFMENHDQLRVASHAFAPFIGDRSERAALGLADTAYLGLMPGHLLLQGGQELEEDASVFGNYAGDSGATSIFDFVYQSQTRTWLYEARPQWMSDFRSRYQDLLALKHLPAFSAPHQTGAASLVDLDPANGYKTQSQWVASYLRFAAGEAYLVVTNGDPQVGHEATIHFTTQMNFDALGALAAMNIENSDKRYLFQEVFSRKGWEPTDPAVQGRGLPGWMFYRSGDVPSGVFLGVVPAATTYIFKISAL